MLPSCLGNPFGLTAHAPSFRKNPSGALADDAMLRRQPYPIGSCQTIITQLSGSVQSRIVGIACTAFLLMLANHIDEHSHGARNERRNLAVPD